MNNGANYSDDNDWMSACACLQLSRFPAYRSSFHSRDVSRFRFGA
jgi:hypothetical protein